MTERTLAVLLVEDNPGDERLVREMLREALPQGHQLLTAHDLASAVALLAERSVDVILSDLSLPDSVGLATYTGLRAVRDDIPIVLLTGLSDTSVAISAVQQGAQDYLVKGEVDASGLARSVRYAVERQDLLRRLRKAEEERVLAERLRGVLELASATCHELTQPLQILASFLPVCERAGVAGDELEAVLTVIADQVRRLSEVTHKLNHITRYETCEYPGGRRTMIDIDRATQPAVGADGLVELRPPAGPADSSDHSSARMRPAQGAGM